jgi:hypothetical protein
MAYGTPPKSTHTLPAGRRAFGENPTVHSKSTKRYGRNPTEGDIHGSTGQQPADIEVRPIAGSIPQRTVGGPAVIAAQVVGYAPDGSGKYIKPSYPNASRSLHGNADFSGSAARSREEPRGGLQNDSIKSETGIDSP